MKKVLLSAVLGLMAAFNTHHASAQFEYSFTKPGQAYAPLTSATSVSKGSLWTADTTFVIPLGFNFKLAGTSISKIYLSGGNYLSATQNAAKQSGFIMLGTGLMDRGQNIMTSKSDIRYTTSGTSGNRIFKLEVFNAGFEDEYFNNGELKDSISLQVWLYEGSNAIEFHYGSSHVSAFSDYFGGIMRSGYLKNMDTATGAFEKFYVVNETIAATAIDSITDFSEFKGLSSVPASGTVFRFTPKSSGTTGVQQVTSGTLAKVYPTQCNGILNIEQSRNRPVSYTIANVSGRVIAQGNANTGKTTVDLSGVPSGIYIIRLSDAANNTYEGQQFVRL